MDRQLLHRPIACIFFIGAVSASPSLLAGPIETWQGARAEVDASGRHASQQGSVATADAGGWDTIRYTSPNANLGPDAYRVSAESAARAEVLGTPDALLRVGMSATVGNPGTRPMYPSSVTSTSAEASWIGDRIHVAANDQASLPGSVRLGVGVELENYWSEHNPFYDGTTIRGVVDLNLGGRLIRLQDDLALHSYPPLSFSSWLVRRGFDAAEEVSPRVGSYRLGHRALAFLDLAIDEEGWTDPFDLSIKTRAYLPLLSNEGLLLRLDNLTLSLVDLTLPDGTPLSDAGYTATFESGLALPQPIPEPTAIACWLALVTAATGWLRSRRGLRPRTAPAGPALAA